MKRTTRMDLKTELKEMIIEELHLDGTSPADITSDDALFGEGLGLDSLDALQLAVAVEERFGVRIGDEEEGRKAFASVNALAEYIGGHKSSGGASAG